VAEDTAAKLRAAQPDDQSLDIVVTAQRRSERLSEVPLSITAFEAKGLAATGAVDIRALTQIAPGVNFQAFGSSAQPVIRGVGSNGGGIGDSSNVALYIDGVYQPLQGANFPRFEDVERVEILKGPQGTLYGRNAAGGAIVINTLEPKFTTTGRLMASYSRFNEKQFQGFATTPLSDTIAISVAGDYTHNDGFRRDIFLNRKVGYLRSESIKAKILFEPSNQTSILLSTYYRHSNDLTNFGNQPLDGNSQLKRQNPALLIATDPNTSSLNFEAQNKVTAWGGSLRITQDLGIATLTSLTALTRARQYVLTDSDLTPASFSHAEVIPTDDTFQQDVTLTSNTSTPFGWLLGASFFSERATYSTLTYGGFTTTATPTVGLPPFGLPLTRGTIIPEARNKSIAGFAELSYNLTDSLTVIAGARISNEKPSFTGYLLNNATLQPNLATQVSAKDSFSSFTPHFALRYRIARSVNVYASYSRGFKSGVFLPNALQTSAVKPEDIDAFEVGIKGSPSAALTFDAAAYHYNYRNLQFQSFGAVASITSLRNAARAEIYGFEANASVKPFRELTLRGGIAYTHGEYKDFVGAQGYAPVVDANGVPIGGNRLFSFDASGRPLIRTPRVQASGTITYEHEMSGGGEIGGSITGSHSSSMYHDVSGNTRQPPVTVVNANIQYKLPDRPIRLTGFLNNVFNEKYIVGIILAGVGTSVTYSRPVTYGLRVEYLF
jgi:iron complex outermembrane receptor protein